MDFRRRFPLRIWHPPVDEEVEAELQFHLDMRQRELMDGGMSEVDARRAALERFGDYARTRRECRILGHRREKRMRLLQYLAELRQDGMFALRQMLKAPGFAAVAVVTLAIGIGATTAIFSALNAVVLRPLPVVGPERVVYVSASSRVSSELISDMGLPNAHFLELLEEQQSFHAVAAKTWRSFSLARDGGSEHVVGAPVTGEYFEVFRTPPALGRVFGPEEDQPGREQVVVLSHRAWMWHFGGDRGVVGTDILLNQRPYTVLGVMPASFDFTAASEALWVPMAWSPDERRTADQHHLTVVARLRDGVSLAQANQDVAAIAERRKQRQPGGPDRWLHVTPLLDYYVGSYRETMFVLLGAVACVLLIGCGNVSNLLLARGASRGRELAVRLALGAGKGRLLRQLLTESVCLGLVAAACGVWVAHWLLELLVAASPPGVPRLEQAELDAGALTFAVLIAVGASGLSGLAAAWRGSRADLNATLKDGARGCVSTGPRDLVRSTLIAGEVALALVLLVCAGLLIRTAVEAQHVDPGFEPAGVYSGRLLLPAAKYPDAGSVWTTVRMIEEGIGSLPGVRGAAIAHTVPGVPSFNNSVVAEGNPNTLDYAVQADGVYVSPSYFQVMGQRLVRGRNFAVTDGHDAPPVTIVNDTLARVLWPGQDAIGKRVWSTSPRGLATVVGIAADVRAHGPGEPVPPTFYVPFSQMDDETLQRAVFIVARAEHDPAALAPMVRRTVHEMDPSLPLFGAMTMEDRLAGTLQLARFHTLLLTLLGSVGLVLAAIGIYGVIAYFAAQRTSEIGIRMTLGASRRDVIRLVLRQAAIPVLAGLVGGSLVAVLAARALAAGLTNVRTEDPRTFAVVAAALVLVALAAAFIPARRAASLDPWRALQAG